MKSILITLPIPNNGLSPNARLHWAAKAKLTKNARLASYYIAKVVLNGELPKWTSARTTITYYKKTAAHMDADGALSRLKAALDGIADAGIVSNDKAFSHNPITILKDAANPRVGILIEQIP